jgi:RHS repeat-associated protein
MPIEEESFSMGSRLINRDDITRNTVCPRGIDMIEAERVNSTNPNDPLLNNPSRVFPVYDGHGNMVASLKRGNGSFTLANEKRYDAWGQVRYDDGVGTSDHVINPRNRYCANLGHWDDDVLGLTYMRARWYEASTGRFVSEDPAMDGANWFGYCSGDPMQYADASGKNKWKVIAWSWGQMLGYTAAMAAIIISSLTQVDYVRKLNTVASCLALSVAGFAVALGGTESPFELKLAMSTLAASAGLMRFLSSLAGLLSSSDKLKCNVAFAAVIYSTIYTLMIAGALLGIEMDMSQ